MLAPDKTEKTDHAGDTVFVLSWSYPDGSSFGIERVYTTRESAEEDCDLLNKHTTVKWGITSATLYE